MHGLGHILAFMHVADSHNFTAAAEQLGMSKATVSKQVARLEADLGVRLLKRTTRSVALTEPGVRFYGRCRQIMAELEAANAEIRESTSRGRERLRIGASTAFGRLHLAAALNGFLEQAPATELDIVFAEPAGAALEAGFDAALRIARQTPPGRASRRLAPWRRVLCAAPRYLEAHETIARPGDLVDHDCLICAGAGGGDTWRLSGASGSRSVKVSGRLRVNCADTLRLAVRAGLGLALVPEVLVRDDLAAGEVRRVLPDYADDSCALYALHPDSAAPSPKLADLFDFLEAYYRAPGRSAERPEGARARLAGRARAAGFAGAARGARPRRLALDQPP